MWNWLKRLLALRNTPQPAAEPRAYYQAHPPRCVAGFRAKPIELRRIQFDGHVDRLNITFLLACVCGNGCHYVSGFSWRNPDYRNELVFLSPLDLRCASCGKVEELLDTDRHGYDAEIGGIVATVRGQGEKMEYQCDQCGSQPFEICVRFEYADHVFDDQKHRGQAQDLFSWFSLVGKCPGCSRILRIADFECITKR